MAEVDYGTLKKGGFMRQVQKDRFSLRLRVIGGHLSADKLAKIREIANQYGQGYIHLTSRQGVEIPFIALEHIEAVKQELATVGLQPGACGPRVRTVTACQGSQICSSSLIETTELAQELDARYFGQELPHKFKIGITGCRNNCLKAEENDLGVKGGLFPEWQGSTCTYCGLCEAVCPAKAIIVHEASLTLNTPVCEYCGKCVKSCPSDAWQGRKGYLLSFGGMFGNTIKPGMHLIPMLFEKDQVFTAADTTLKFFAAYAHSGERLGKTLSRVGPEILQKKLKEALA
ncbi:MAG: 4Fe-4S binding protein [Spirochaetaceae bacterium]|jgi:dissimilatory sulfite reductase (desulfoviridin) alpha/beta subunit|nr:4Fe-4S binding protein [Spirochaetaceae bacterium]